MKMRKPFYENKGAWLKQEDQKLVDYIRKHGEGSWRSLPQAAGLLRCGKSCRLRWMNYLRPDLKPGNFREDEEDLIIKLRALLGNRLPGRTEKRNKELLEIALTKETNAKRYLPEQPQTRPPHGRSEQIPSAEKQLFGIQVPRSEEDKEAGSVLQCPSEPNGTTTALPVPDLNLDLTIHLPFMRENKFHVEQGYLEL